MNFPKAERLPPLPDAVPLEDVSDRQRSGRIECYIHSDSITMNKGGALVKIVCDTDFAARTNEFYAFSRMVAKLAYAASAADWAGVVKVYPHLADDLEKLKSVLREEVSITDVHILKISP